METKKINFKSDFHFFLHLTDCDGKEIGVPDYDWTAYFYTASRSQTYVASYKNGVYTNCFDDNGKLHIVCDNHRLPCGTLKCEFIAELPNDIYPDGYERVVNPEPIGIELVRGKSDCSDDMDAELVLPYIKGEQGPVGPQGQKGDKGDRGADGKDGLSAYEQAMQGGYQGTEEDFKQALANVSELPPSDTIVIHSPSDTELEAIEPNIVTNALRKNEQFLPDSEKAQVLKNLGNPEFKLFDNMWVQAGGTVIVSGITYGLNGLTDITYEEALVIMQNSATIFRLVSSGLPSFTFAGSNIRTTFPLEGYGNAYGPCNLYGTFKNCKNLEVVILKKGNISGLNDTFYGCDKLKTVTFENEYQLNSISTNAFYGCYALQTLKFKSLKVSFSVKDSPEITRESLSYIVTIAANTSLITITVHPDVYAKLTDESNTEWYALLVLAATKNIQFATT